MAQKVVNEAVSRFAGETLTVPASNGTRSAYTVRPGSQEILIEPVAAMRLQFVPKIASLLFYDASQPAALQWVDILASWPQLFDREIATPKPTFLGSMTSADRLYIGTMGFIGGFVVDLGATVNSIAATLTAEFSPAVGDFAAMTVATDGTASAGATLAIDGLVTLTVPAGWSPRMLRDLVPSLNPPKIGPLYWGRYAVSATLTAGVILNNLTNIGRIAPGTDDVAARTGGAFLKASTEYTMDVSPEVGSLEIMAQAASATTARASWIRR